MTSPEGQFPQYRSEYQFIEVASSLGNLVYENSNNGLQSAYTAIRQRHNSVIYQDSFVDRVRELSHEDLFFRSITQTSAIAIDNGRYEIALKHANRAHAYREIATRDFIGDQTKAVTLSLEIHRKLAKKMGEKISSSHFDLSKEWNEYEENIQRMRVDNSVNGEYLSLREAIHQIVRSGKFGDGTKHQFDPRALISIEEVFTKIEMP